MSENAERCEMRKSIVVLGSLLLFSPAFAGSSDVYDDNGDHIGTAQDCSGGECDVTNDNGDHIGTAEDCMRGDECDVTNDNGDHIGTAESDE